MMKDIIEEAESKDEGTHPLSSITSNVSTDTKEDQDPTFIESILVEDDRDFSFRDIFTNHHDDDALLEFDSWAEGGEPIRVTVLDNDFVAYSESIRLTELVGDEYLDVFDTSMEDFTEQLSHDMDKLSEKVLGNNVGSHLAMEGSDELTPGTKARECVAALAFTGL
jgi:ABC-type uncharacterized transport system involved in gliding motility auxiliary subunit